MLLEVESVFGGLGLRLGGVGRKAVGESRCAINTSNTFTRNSTLEDTMLPSNAIYATDALLLHCQS